MLASSRRKLFGASMIGAGALPNGIGLRAAAANIDRKGQIMLDRIPDLPRGLIEP